MSYSRHGLVCAGSTACFMHYIGVEIYPCELLLICLRTIRNGTICLQGILYVNCFLCNKCTKRQTSYFSFINLFISYVIYYLNHLYGRPACSARRFLALGLIPSKGAVATLLASPSSG